MIGLLVLVMLAALAGVIYPYIPGARRWQFGLGAFGAVLAIGVLAPKPDTTAKVTSVDPDGPAGKVPAK